MLTALAIIALVIAVVLAYAATRPNTFSLTRSVDIKAPAEKVFPLINDLRRFNTWNPFAKADPGVKLTYSGAPIGKGSAYDWESSKIGVGRMEIIETTPTKIVAKLDFVKPMEGHNIVEFTLVPRGDTTNVTWAMRGPMTFVAKIMHLFFSMERMVGGEFEKGLASMKAVAEA